CTPVLALSQIRCDAQHCRASCRLLGWCSPGSRSPARVLFSSVQVVPCLPGVCGLFLSSLYCPCFVSWPALSRLLRNAVLGSRPATRNKSAFSRERPAAFFVAPSVPFTLFV